MNFNLNTLGIPTDWDYEEPIRNGTNPKAETASVRVIFDNIEQECINLINKYPLVLGCVAWFTSAPIANALANIKYGCQTVVQKEDFLRPDISELSQTKWNRSLFFRRMYNTLRCDIDRVHFYDDFKGGLSYMGDPSMYPVRCVGNHNAQKNPASPRMHHKFLVMCEVDKKPYDDFDYFYNILPKAVWTGSFNLTKNAGMSLENVVVIESIEIAKHYYEEWQKIYALSEPLDWTSEWCAPEYRLGS